MAIIKTKTQPSTVPVPESTEAVLCDLCDSPLPLGEEPLECPECEAVIGSCCAVVDEDTNELLYCVECDDDPDEDDEDLDSDDEDSDDDDYELDSDEENDEN